MEALAVLGGGVWLAKSLLDAPQRPVNPTRAELREQMPETPREFLMHEFRENGMIAPNFASSTNRVPWDPLNPPYHIHRVGEHHMDNPMEECFTLRTNGLEHNRLDWQEQFVKGRMNVARKTKQPLYNGFSDEMALAPDRRTQHMGWNFLPALPTDQDYNDAAQLAKAIPKDPQLFTPDAFYPTASGLPFRYAPY